MHCYICSLKDLRKNVDERNKVTEIVLRDKFGLCKDLRTYFSSFIQHGVDEWVCMRCHGVHCMVLPLQRISHVDRYHASTWDYNKESSDPPDFRRAVTPHEYITAVEQSGLYRISQISRSAQLSRCAVMPDADMRVAIKEETEVWGHFPHGIASSYEAIQRVMPYTYIFDVPHTTPKTVCQYPWTRYDDDGSEESDPNWHWPENDPDYPYNYDSAGSD